MEKNFYTDNFERLLKEKSDEFRMYPSRRVWHSIYNDLHPSRRWPSAAMSMVLLLTLVFIGYLNTSENLSDKSRNVRSSMSTNASSSANSTTGSSDPRSNSAIADANINQGNTGITDQSGNGTNPLNNDVTSGPLSSNNGNINSNSNNTKNIPANGQDLNSLTNNPNNRISQANNTPSNRNVVAEMDNYIQSSQLIADVTTAKQKNKTAGVATKANGTNTSQEDNSSAITNSNSDNTEKTPLTNTDQSDAKKAADLAKNQTKKTAPNLTAKVNPADEISWIEDYAFHNKSSRKKWKDRMNYEVYATPSVGYRKLQNTANPEPVVTSLTANPVMNQGVNSSVNQKPSLGLEAGVGFSYSFAKKFRLKAGVQLNYTSYGIKTDQTNHPILTTLMLNNLNTGYSYLEPKTTSLSNTSGVQPVTVHNKTYQVSIPVGVSVKLAGNQKLEWYIGGSVQPTYVVGGKSYLISSDYQNYVLESSMIRKWNLNTSIETYLNYKMGSYTLQVGPQLRYQVLSTYNKKYTIKENLYNTGLKLGIVKGF